MENDYLKSIEWQKMRKKILNRDNYTCQNCETFNPSFDFVTVFCPHDNTIELHKYESTPDQSVYILDTERTGITIEMDFGSIYLILPKLQIHHKRYIEGKQFWDYDENDLVTLCKECHTLLHNKIEIPIFDSNNNFIENRKYHAIDDDNMGIDDEFEPWTFKRYNHNENGKEYTLTDKIETTLRYIVSENQIHKSEEIKSITQKMVDDFFKKYLPSYRTK